ncbi:MAG: hypothetical protein AAF916_12410, partial [Planctomycetota bacterium]
LMAGAAGVAAPPALLAGHAAIGATPAWAAPWVVNPYTAGAARTLGAALGAYQTVTAGADAYRNYQSGVLSGSDFAFVSAGLAGTYASATTRLLNNPSAVARHAAWADNLFAVSGSIEKLGIRALKHSGGDWRLSESLFNEYLGKVSHRLRMQGSRYGVEIQPAALAGGERVPPYLHFRYHVGRGPFISDGAGRPILFAYPGSRRLDAGIVDMTVGGNRSGLRPLVAGFDITLNARKSHIVEYYQQFFGEIPIYDIRLQ